MREEVFLSDGRIYPYEGSFRRNYHLHSGITKPLEHLGFIGINKDIGNYRVLASAAMVLAEITPRNYQNTDIHPDEWESERRILFDGGIQIYQDGLVEGIEGYTLNRTGRIWVSTEDTPEIREEGLLHLIGDTPENITAILAGYESQDNSRRKAENELIKFVEATVQ